MLAFCSYHSIQVPYIKNNSKQVFMGYVSGFPALFVGRFADEAGPRAGIEGQASEGQWLSKTGCEITCSESRL